MGNLLGEPFKDYVSNQINDRQAVHGKVNRTVEELQYLNSRNAWIKLASGTSFDQKRLDLLKKNKGDQEENPLLTGITPGFDLAIQNVLFNGLSSFGEVDVNKIVKEQNKQADIKNQPGLKINKDNFGKSYELGRNGGKYFNYSQTPRAGIAGTNRAYGVGGTGQHGYSPMPGIIDADIKDLNRGSIKKATINIKAHNRNQFDVIDALYLRLGYTIMLEWGVDKYLNTLDGSGNGNVAPMGTTLIDRQFWKYNKSSYNEVLPAIENLRRQYNGNYDGMFGVISNFSWTFEADGTYNIKLEIMSQGDIIESLKANTPPTDQDASLNQYDVLSLKQLESSVANEQQFYEILYPGLDILVENWLKDPNWGFPVVTIDTSPVKEAIQVSGTFVLKNPNAGQAIYSLLFGDGVKELEDSVTNSAKNLLKEVFPFDPGRDPNGFDYPNFKRKEFTNDNQKRQNLIRNGTYSFMDDEGKIKNRKASTERYIYDALRASLSKFRRGLRLNIENSNESTFKGINKENINKKFLNIEESQKYFVNLILTEAGGDESKVFPLIRRLIMNNVDPSIFKKELFLYFRDRNLAGGSEDPTIKDDISTEDNPNAEEEQEREEARESLENEKGKNKVNSYFYKIQQYFGISISELWTRISNSATGNQGANTNTPKITALEKDLGKIVNPLSPNDSQKWSNEVGFPNYSQTQEISVDVIQLNQLQPIPNQFFIRLGTFLEFFEKDVIPRIEEGSNKDQPMILIDYNPKNNICYVVDNVISLDPNKTIVSNSNFFTPNGGERIYPEINQFIHNVDGFLYGNLMNIYFSFDRIKKIMDDVDNNNQVSVFKVLKNLATDINESLGNINNIEPVIDKETNTIRFIDQTSIPGIETIAYELDYEIPTEEEATLEIFGLNPKDNTSNFVRSAGITTEISKEYATIITIGATANGAIPGAESTAFSKWNVGIRDRFKDNIIDAGVKGTIEEQNKNILKQYVQFLSTTFPKLGLSEEGDKFIISSDFIDLNKSTVSAYYVYAQAQTSKQDPEYIESSIGFLPFNLKISMDGLSGIKIYNKIKVNTSFLPSNYGETLSFIVTGVNHKLSNNEWVTSLDTIATTKEKQDVAPNTVDTEELLNGEKQPQPSSRTSTGPVAPKSEIIEDVSFRPTEPI